MKGITLARWKQLDSLVEEALVRPKDERTAFLRATCGHDVDLYAESVALLERLEDAEKALGESVAEYAAPLVGSGGEDAHESELAPGTDIGAYRVLRELGRGGMGTVYLAERADGTFEKEVALKLVKRGMDTDEVVRRFRRERRIHAGLDHPGIARLLDAGAAPDGRPFLVMEYVEGEPITTYADRLRLDIDTRLALFEQVCEAVRYAHRRLVIHRDLKPSNILVMEDEDGAPQAKLLDFGIARLLDPDLDDTVTGRGSHPLTPAYAAPEQLRGEGVTTAADVYALGVVLYELLVGERPQRPPKAPSSVVTPESATARRATPERLSRRLRGDLDTISLKALREDPDERYPSVQLLLDDLERLRTDLPIRARRATVGYRLRKYVVRQRVQVAVVALVFVALAGGAGLALWQAQEARRNAERSDNVRDFLIEILEEANPDSARANSAAVSAILELASSRIENELADEPEMQIEILGVLAELYRKLDRYDQAALLFERAIELCRLHENPPLQLATLVNGLAGVRLEQGAFAESEQLYREALELRQTHAPRSEEVLNTTANLGNLYRVQKRVAEADSFLSFAAELQREIGIEDRSVFAITLDRIASLRRIMGRFSEAEELSREALSLRIAALGPDHRHVYLSKNNLGLILFQSGQLAAAETMYQEVYAFNLERLGLEHRETATTILHLADVAFQRGDFGEAESLYRQANEIYLLLLGVEHSVVALSHLRLASTLLARGDLEGAELLADRGLADYRAAFDDAHQDVGAAYDVVGDVLLARGRYDEAENHYARALSIQRDTLAAGHARLADPLIGLGRVYTAQGNPSEAEQPLREALTILENALVPGALDTAEARLYLGECLALLGRGTEARRLLLAAYDDLRPIRGDDNATVEAARVALARL